MPKRERSVAEAVAEGLSNKEIALRLALTERTVKAHLAAVFDKLGVRDRLQLVVRIGASLRANAAPAGATGGSPTTSGGSSLAAQNSPGSAGNGSDGAQTSLVRAGPSPKSATNSSLSIPRSLKIRNGSRSNSSPSR